MGSKSSDAKPQKKTLDLLASRRLVLASQYEAEAAVAKARAELARVEARLIDAGYHASDNASVW